MTRDYLLTIIGLFCCFFSFGQSKVSGIVLDESRTPLIGATILIEGSSTGEISDYEGRFSLAVPSLDTTLIVSYIGYATQKVAIAGQKDVTIILQSNAKLLDAVTVTALNIKRSEKSLGYAVQSIGGEEVNQSTSTNLVSALSGKSAGVQVITNGTGPGQSASVVIRGYSSISGDNQPLFVIDGVPINNRTDMRTNTLGGASNLDLDFGNGASEINPNDIESISVLKGANATALYGSRAANGAVIITTKSGSNRKGIGITLESKYTFESILKAPEYQDQFGQGKEFNFNFVDGYGAGTSDGVDESWGPPLDGQLIAQHDSPTANNLRGGDVHTLNRVLGSSGVDLERRGEITPTPFVYGGNPVEKFLETGLTQVHSLSFYGGNDQGNYRIGYTFLDNKGMVPNTDLRRNTLSLSGNYKLTDKISLNSKVNYIHSGSDNRHVNGYGTESVMYLFIWWGQQVNVHSLRDYWQKGLEGFQQFNYNYNYHDNPYFTMYENTNALDKNRIIGNLSATYDINDQWKVMIRGGRDFFSEYRTIKRAYSTQRFPQGQYREDKINFAETNLDFLVTYDQAIEDWHVNANFGGNQMVQKDHFNSLMANKLLIPEVYSFNNVNGSLVQKIHRPEKQINSLYAFTQLSYQDKAFVDITARNDWSSTLPKENNSYFYPSISLSVLLHEWIDLNPSDLWSYVKLRGGWAQVGSDTDPYNLVNGYILGIPVGDASTVQPSNTLAKLDLHPEIQTSWEIGTDIRLLQNKIGIDLTYYNTISKNQILNIDLPPTSGKTARTINAGEIQNQGIELLLDFDVLETSTFSWNSMFNFSLNRNEVLDLPEEVDNYSIRSNGYTLVAKEGGSLGDMWGTGILRVEDKNSEHYGKVIYTDKGNIQQDNTLRKLGNFNPDFNLGWRNLLKYKNFTLSFLFDWRQGGQLLSRTRLIGATSGNVVETLWGRTPEYGGAHPGIAKSGYSTFDDDMNWIVDAVIGDGVVIDVENSTEENTVYKINDWPISANAYHNARYRRQNTSEGIYDATFIKLREARLSYDLPQNLLRTLNIQSVQIALIGSNLWLWAKEFNHGDPELLQFSGGGFIPGVEDAQVPTARSLGFSLNIKF